MTIKKIESHLPVLSEVIIADRKSKLGALFSSLNPDVSNDAIITYVDLHWRLEIEKDFREAMINRFNLHPIAFIMSLSSVDGRCSQSECPLLVDDSKSLIFYYDIILYSSIDKAESEAKFAEIKKIYESFIKPVVKRKIPGNVFILTSDTRGRLSFKPYKLPGLRIKIESNYNDDFIGINESIISRLKSQNDKGVVILHGSPGTGKTYYIRHLIRCLNKKCLYVPPNMVPSITSPNFIRLLSRHKNSVIIIEDADNLLRKRDESNTNDVSSLLNITDGLLTDVLNIQLVCTFNTDISNIDAAFLRKGRIIARYEFGNLSADKASALSLSLGHKIVYKSPVSLSEVYNPSELSYSSEKSKLGFK